MGSPHAADPFGTAELRRRVLAAWTDSPARFREDANAEEDLVRDADRGIGKHRGRGGRTGAEPLQQPPGGGGPGDAEPEDEAAHQSVTPGIDRKSA